MTQMTKENVMIEIGNDRIKDNQIMLIILGVIFPSLMFLFYLIYKTQNCLIIFIISILFFTIALVYNLRLYRVSVNKEYFYIENILRKFKIEKNEFITIKVECTFPYILSITFTGGRRYLFLLNSSDSFKAMFSFNKKKIETQIINKVDHIIQDTSSTSGFV